MPERGRLARAAGRRSSSRLLVLTYHRVLHPERDPSANPSLVSATPEAFEDQMRHLARHYRVVSGEDVLEAHRAGRPLPARAVLLTFDDAYADFAANVHPVLRRYGLPAVLFVPTAFPDRPEARFWWDRLYAALLATRARSVTVDPLGVLPLAGEEARWTTFRAIELHVKTLPHEDGMALVHRLCERLVGGAGDDGAASGVLGWDELRSLARDGVTLGGHTRTHPLLTRLAADRLREEVEGSRADLERETGTRPALFSYPGGAHDERIVEAVRRAGYELAFACHRGRNRLPFPEPLSLRRANVTRRSSALVFRLRLLGPVARLDRWRHERRRRPSSLHPRSAPS